MSVALQGEKRKRAAAPSKKEVSFRKQLCMDLWANYKSDLDDAVSFQRPSPMPFEPYEWQESAYARVIGRFESGGARMGICAPPGTGKSELARMLLASVKSNLPSLVISPQITHEQWKLGMQKFGHNVVPLEISSAPPLPAFSIVSSEAFALRPTGPEMWAMIIVDERVSMSSIRAGAIERAMTQNFIMLSVEAPSGAYLRILTHLKCRIEELYAKDMIFGGMDVALPDVNHTAHSVTMPVHVTVGTRPDADYISRKYLYAKMDTLRAILENTPLGEKTAVILPPISRGFTVTIAKKGGDYFVIGDESTTVEIDAIGTVKRIPSYAKNLHWGDTLKCLPTVSTSMGADARYHKLRGFMESDEPALVTTCAAVMCGLDLQRVTNVVFLYGEPDKAVMDQVIGRFRRPGAFRNTINVHTIMFSRSFETVPCRYYEYAPERLKKELARYSTI